jgi:hypothetical protein
MQRSEIRGRFAARKTRITLSLHPGYACLGQGLESRLASQAQLAPTDGDLVAMRPEADALCSL